MSALFCASANAQNLGGKKILKLPGRYNSLDISLQNSYIAGDKKEYLSSPWIVYSDRDRNKTTIKLGAEDKQTYLAFLERFYVLDDKKEYLLLVKDPNINGLKLSYSARSFGWINKKNLLLSRRCLVEKNGRLSVTALTINNLRNLRQEAVGLPYNLQFRRAPNNKASYNGHTTNFYEIYFVYKVTDKFLLLGKQIRIPESGVGKHKIILGWAPTSQLLFWKNRMAFEPNWNPAGVEERKNGKRTILFKDKRSSVIYQTRGIINKRAVLWEDDPLTYERPQNKFPFILLSDKMENNTGIFLVNVSSEIFMNEKSGLHKYSSGFNELLKKQGYNSREINKFKILKIPINFQAYLNLKIEHQIHPLFNRIILVSLIDMTRILDILSKLNQAASSNFPRQKLHRTFGELYKQYREEDFDNAKNSLKLVEAYSQLFGIDVPVKDTLIHQLRIKDIRDERIFKDRVLNDYLGSLKEKENVIRKIINQDNYEYSFYSNDVKYFLIDENILP